MATIGTAIRETATSTAFSIKKIAGAVKTGVEIDKIPKTVQAAADVASATGSNLANVADIITTASTIWEKTDVATIGDRIAQASNVSKLAVEDLKTILSLAGAAADTAGISLEQTLATDATLRNAGIIATGSRQLMMEFKFKDPSSSHFRIKPNLYRQQPASGVEES